MTARLLPPAVLAKFDATKTLLTRTVSLAERCGRQEAAMPLKARLKTMDAAALFVIVGEVKAGKSSFINALLGDTVCEVAPDPCTAVIQELVHGATRETVTLGDHWQRLFLPNPVLEDLSIVDTPGTNSIIRNHQTITENYIPQSDLVIFVFSAKNPHTNTAWELLSLIREEWHRKTVFLLQQSDLATQAELSVNRDRVMQYARERNVQNPIVFAVSARRELEGSSDSGFPEFRAYLRKTLEEGEAWHLKIEGSRQTVTKVADDLLSALRQSRAALEEDRVFLRTLQQVVEARRGKADAFRRMAVDSVCATYDRLMEGLKAEFRAGLAMGTLLRRAIPGVRDKSVPAWLADLEEGFTRRAREAVDDDIARLREDITVEIEQLFAELDLRLSEHQQRAGTGTLPLYDRAGVLESVRRSVKALTLAEVYPQGLPTGHESLGTQTLAGGGIAALGTVIALSTNIVLVDVTGGILTLAGLGLMLGTMLWRRGATLKEIEEKLDASRADFRARVDQRIAELFDKLFLELNHRVMQPTAIIDGKLEELAPLLDECEAVLEQSEGR